MVRKDYFLEQWPAAREDAALAVEAMPAEKLDFRPQDDMMTFREAARHMVQVGRAITGLMIDRESDLADGQFRTKLEKYAQPVPDDQAGLAAALRSSVREHCEVLGQQPDAFFGEMVTKWDGTRLTRGEMMQFVREHELTHRMQLFMYLRLNGIVPPTTRRKMAKTS